MENKTTFNEYLREAIIKNWDSEALTNYKCQTYLYRDLARKIEKIHIMCRAAGVQPGDKVALCGKNSAEWVMALLSVMTYGAVAVPIMSDFTPETLEHLINHSDAKVLFIDRALWKTVREEKMPGLIGVVCVEDYSLLYYRDEAIHYARQNLNSLFGQMYPERFTPADVKFAYVKPDETVLINYTAGSTGFSKGVMVPEKALWSNIQFCIDDLHFLKPGDNMLSILPLAHMYGLVVELLHSIVKGCHVYLLNRTPSPKILLEAFGVTKPKLVISVPLVLEKIIRTRVFPRLHTPLMKFMLHVPGVKQNILAKVRKTLMDAFGGNLIEMIVGGAPLAKDVEDFLRAIDFPVTVGYGMTECAPLISYCPHETHRAGSCGKVVDRMKVRIDSPDPAHRPGILWVKGENVMKGYYKNDEATQAVVRKGWLNTGDICLLDDDGYLYIKGRDKNMILGPSGQNIYPEEIEAVINEQPIVVESVVVDNNGAIEALVYPDFDLLQEKGLNGDDEIKNALKEMIKDVNRRLPSYSQVSKVHLQYDEFEKTPKRSIKRYLYQH